MNTKPFVVFLATLALPVAAFAQARPSASGTPTTPSSASGSPAGSTDIGKYSGYDALSRQGRTGDYLLGKVSVAGGALPWDAIPVNVTCSGKTAYTSVTDSKGNFVIAPAASPGVTSTAPASADPKSKPAAAFMGCTVEAALPGFNSTTVTIADRNITDNPDIGTITLNREENSVGSVVSNTTASAPKDAAKSFEKARTEWLEKKPDKAQKDLEKAVQLDPQFAEAWYQLGKIQEAANSPDAANSFAKAAAADPQFILPYEHLAILDAKAGKWQEVADATAHELQLNPRGTALIWYYSAIANYKLGKKDVAETAAEKSLAMDPLHTVPNTEQLLAVILADKQDFAAALAHLRNAQTYIAPGPNADLIKQQIAQLEKIVATPSSK
jgi:tetratricopeptide (TPR) repeat protein